MKLSNALNRDLAAKEGKVIDQTIAVDGILGAIAGFFTVYIMPLRLFLLLL